MNSFETDRFAECEGDPLSWDFTLTAEEQETVSKIADANMQRILSVVLYGDGIQAANSQEYPSARAVLNRCAKVAVERAVTLMHPSQAYTLKIMHMGDKRPGAPYGYDARRAPHLVQAASKEFGVYRQRIIANNVDYQTWGDRYRPSIDDYNPVLFAARVGLRMSLMASNRDVQHNGADYLTASQTLTAKERSIIATLYGLRPEGENPLKPVRNFTELAEMHGYSSAGIVSQQASRPMRRLAMNPRDSEKEGLTDRNLKPLPDDDPSGALRLIRAAMDNNRITVSGRAEDYIDAYSDNLLAALLQKDDCRFIFDNLKILPKIITTNAYKAISRYAKKSSSRIEGQFDRDVAIIEQYLRDVDSMRSDGDPDPVFEALFSKPRTS